MRKFAYAAMFFGAMAFATTSCSEKPKDATEVAEDANEAKVDDNMTGLTGDEDAKMDDADFMMKAAEGSMLEIEASKMALKMSSDAKVKDVANMMIKDHTKASDELMGIAKAKMVSLPVALSNDKQEKLNDLGKKTGQEFDKAYMDLMVDSHEKDVDLFKMGAEKCMDPSVKTFASNTLPVVQGHLTMVDHDHDHDHKM